METEREKLERIVEQATKIQVMELEFLSADSEGNAIEGSEHIMMAIYNLENISDEEVEKLLANGSYKYDTRILITDPDRLASLFPHRGETKKIGTVETFWRPRDYMGDFVNCECSHCGFVIRAVQAVEFGSSSTDYADVKYQFCPKCGNRMAHKSGITITPKSKEK